MFLQATFKKQFGEGQIKDDFYTNLKEEVTLAGYRRHLQVKEAPGPLTRQEEEMKEIKEVKSMHIQHRATNSLEFNQ